MDSKQYWDNKIVEWEDSIRGKDVSWVERVAARFRRPLIVRRELCMQILKKYGKGKSIIELGCGSGFFAFRALREVHPKKITGIDISPKAIDRANKIKKDLGIKSNINFMVGDANSVYLPAGDITIGLGFLDYLTDREIVDLFKNMKSKYFLFTFSEKRPSLLRLAHILYLISQKCPKHYYYTKKEIVSFIDKRFSSIRVISDRKMSFGCIVHNLPI